MIDEAILITSDLWSFAKLRFLYQELLQVRIHPSGYLELALGLMLRWVSENTNGAFSAWKR